MVKLFHDEQVEEAVKDMEEEEDVGDKYAEGHTPSIPLEMLAEHHPSPSTPHYTHKYDRGVVYLSRIPPYMTPTILRGLMQAYGEVDRIYLAPEDARNRRARRKRGLNARKKYVEGWVEYVDYRVAEMVAENLNQTMIGEQVGKRSKYYSDLWSMRFLPNFTWEQLNADIHEREKIQRMKLREELVVVRRENKHIKRRVKGRGGVVGLGEELGKLRNRYRQYDTAAGEKYQQASSATLSYLE